MNDLAKMVLEAEPGTRALWGICGGLGWVLCKYLLYKLVRVRSGGP